MDPFKISKRAITALMCFTKMRGNKKNFFIQEGPIQSCWTGTHNKKYCYTQVILDVSFPLSFTVDLPLFLKTLTELKFEEMLFLDDHILLLRENQSCKFHYERVENLITSGLQLPSAPFFQFEFDYRTIKEIKKCKYGRFMMGGRHGKVVFYIPGVCWDVGTLGETEHEFAFEADCAHIMCLPTKDYEVSFYRLSENSGAIAFIDNSIGLMHYVACYDGKNTFWEGNSIHKRRGI